MDGKTAPVPVPGTGRDAGSETETGSGAGAGPVTVRDAGTEPATVIDTGPVLKTGRDAGCELEPGSDTGSVPETGRDAGAEPEPGSDDEPENPKPTPMGRNFYLVMALIGVLCLLIIFLNIPNTRASAETTLVTTNWTLESYAGASGMLVPVYSGTAVTAQFAKDGIMTGSAGCNRYIATYTIDDYDLSITSPGLTKMHCTAPGVMNQESAFVSLLPKVTAIRIYGEELNMYNVSGRQILVFSAVP
ncbi:MAG: META domain-containing protein [Methanoregula sp.]|nr:META domain-containing protein [Methanoregula sp.]